MPSLTAGLPLPLVLRPRNAALRTNPQVAVNNITTHGSDWLWAVMSVFAFLFICVLMHMLMTRHRQRVYHYLALPLLLIPTITYFTMASDLGSTAVRTEFRQNGIPGRTRQIFWVRYIDWFFTFSLEALALLLMTGVGWSTILFTIGTTMLFSVMFLVGALTSTSYKWGYFIFGILAYFLLAYQLLVAGRPWARRFGTQKYYLPLSVYMLGLLLLYPLCWGLSDAGNVITNDGEQVFYGVLDLLVKGLFAVSLIYVAGQLDFKKLGLWMHDYGRVGYDSIHGEKLSRGGAAGAAPGGRDSGVAYESYAGTGPVPVGQEPVPTSHGGVHV